jgi:hypothetical protein
MGWGNGIGIGWGTRGNSPAVLGYFSIIGSCKGSILEDPTSQLIDISTYSEGDYVDGIPPGGGSNRYILGEIRQNPGTEIIELFGPAFTGC